MKSLLKVLAYIGDGVKGFFDWRKEKKRGKKIDATVDYRTYMRKYYGK